MSIKSTLSFDSEIKTQTRRKCTGMNSKSHFLLESELWDVLQCTVEELSFIQVEYIKTNEMPTALSTETDDVFHTLPFPTSPKDAFLKTSLPQQKITNCFQFLATFPEVWFILFLDSREFLNYLRQKSVFSSLWKIYWIHTVHSKGASVIKVLNLILWLQLPENKQSTKCLVLREKSSCFLRNKAGRGVHATS